jgi:hypothetical protein
MTSLPPHERRQFTRVGFSSAVALTQEAQVTLAELVDISLNGVLVRTPESFVLRADVPCSIGLTLAQEEQIAMQARLVHASDCYLGFECLSMDMDSMTHLRRLIELNMDDPCAPERVLAELIRRNPPSTTAL